LDYDVSSVPLARHWLMRLCHEHAVDPDLLDLLALLSTELVANAVLHGAAPVEVSVSLTGSHDLTGSQETRSAETAVGVTVSCLDGSAQLPSVESVQVEATGGRGVALIDMLASAWGVQPQAGGKRVWFRLDGIRGVGPTPVL